MRKIIFSLIVLMAITNIHSLSAQTWSPPMWVSQHDSSLTWYYILGHGLTVDTFGTPWCGWIVLCPLPISNYIAVSNYNGTWSEPDTIIPFGGFGSCDLTTDANGNIWVVAEDGGLISACFYNGNSWSNLMQVPSQGTCCHYPTAAGDTLGNLYVCWAGGGPGGGHHVWGNTYIQGQWGSPVLISYPGSPEEFAYSMTTDKQGRVWVGWYRFACPYPSICVCFNDGYSWSDTMVIAEYSYAATGPALTVDTAGGIWASWIHANSGDTNYSVSASYYDGNAWSEPMLVSSTVGWYGDFNIAMTSDNKGTVWLTWMSPDNDIYYSYWNGSDWSNPAPIDINPATDYYPRMEFDGERIWVTWISDRGDSAGVYASYTYGLDVGEKPIANRISISMLSQNYPNPFKKTTTFSYALPAPTRVNLSIYDVTGRKITTLVDAYKLSGIHQIDFNATGLASGVYIYRLKTDQFTASRRAVLIK